MGFYWVINIFWCERTPASTGVKDDFGFMLICVRLNEQNMYQIVALVIRMCLYWYSTGSYHSCIV